MTIRKLILIMAGPALLFGSAGASRGSKSTEFYLSPGLQYAAPPDLSSGGACRFPSCVTLCRSCCARI